jgi:hypothetical protein
VLTQISIAFMQNADNFIASRVSPMITVSKQSDKYYVWTKEDWFRDEAQKRGDSEESAGSGMNLSTDNYFCDVWAIHKDIGHLTRGNADAGLNLDQAAAEFVTQRLMLRQEKQWVSDYFAINIWDTDLTGVVGVPGATQFRQWNDYTNSDPIQDMELGKESILITTGMEANTLVLGYQAWRQLKHHPDFVDRVKFTSSDVIAAEVIASMLEIDRIMVAKAVNTTSAEGAATAVTTFTHGKAALLLHVADTPSLLTPSACYTFAWDAVSGGLGEAVGISEFDIEMLKTTRVEGEIAFDNKVVSTDLGVFFASAVA